MQNFDNEKMKNLLDTYINRLYNMHKKTKDLLQRFERINTNIWRVVDDFEKLKISIKKISTNKDCKKVFWHLKPLKCV